VMVFREVMIGTEGMSTPPALERDFVEYFPAIVATVHWGRFGG